MSRRILFSIALAVAVPLGGCVDVHGGAVEASWVLRTPDGRAISDCSCTEPEVSRVRLVLVPLGDDGRRGEDACAGRSSCEFACRRQAGATSFEIPSGKYSISLAALDASGRELTSTPVGSPPVRVPAPILQEVVYGRATQVDAIRIEAACAPSCGGGDNNKVCTRS